MSDPRFEVDRYLDESKGVSSRPKFIFGGWRPVSSLATLYFYLRFVLPPELVGISRLALSRTFASCGCYSLRYYGGSSLIFFTSYFSRAGVLKSAVGSFPSFKCFNNCEFYFGEVGTAAIFCTPTGLTAVLLAAAVAPLSPFSGIDTMLTLSITLPSV